MELKARKPSLRDGRFPRVKALVDTMKRNAVIAVMVGAAAVFAPACSDGNDPNPDGGTTADGGHDGGTTTDSGGDGGGTSLCDTYADGHENRRTFSLDEVASIGHGDYKMMFREIEYFGSDGYATFAYYMSIGGDTDFITMGLGEEETKDVPGVGLARFEACNMTANDCSSYTNPPQGDVNCTVTVASNFSLQ